MAGTSTKNAYIYSLLPKIYFLICNTLNTVLNAKEAVAKSQRQVYTIGSVGWFIPPISVKHFEIKIPEDRYDC